MAGEEEASEREKVNLLKAMRRKGNGKDENADKSSSFLSRHVQSCELSSVCIYLQGLFT